MDEAVVEGLPKTIHTNLEPTMSTPASPAGGALSVPGLRGFMYACEQEILILTWRLTCVPTKLTKEILFSTKFDHKEIV